MNVRCISFFHKISVALTKNGDLMILYDYQTRRIAYFKQEIDYVQKIEAVGGHLDPKAISKDSFALVEKGGQDLKIFVLTKIGQIFVWRENNNGLIQCLFAVSRELWIKDIAVCRNGLYLLSKEGTAYEGIHQSKANNNNNSNTVGTSRDSTSSSNLLFKFVDKDQCDSIRIKRLPLIHRYV